jgi:hypothetical protein
MALQMMAPQSPPYSKQTAATWWVFFNMSGDQGDAA